MTLAEQRRSYIPKIPTFLQQLHNVRCEPLSDNPQISSEIKAQFSHLQSTNYRLVSGLEKRNSPLKVGVVFSGGPASGGHNVLTGLFDALRQMHKESKLIGFIGGFSGLLEQRYITLSEVQIESVRNQGGFDLIGTGRTKLETKSDLDKVHTALEYLDALVVIGGDDSNTNAAVLANYLLSVGSKTSIIGVPKTIDGDLRSKEIEVSFGFDSACKTYAELIGNICKDALSTRKYYHFIKLMGRSASHIALECALLTQPNLTLIGEEKKSLEQCVHAIVDLIIRRQKAGKEFGVIVVPEGLIEFIPEIDKLLKALASNKLGPDEKVTWDHLPEKIKTQLMTQKDPHGNIKVSQISTEELLIELVKKELSKRNFSGNFDCQHHFFGYEGRCCLPTNFDANYAYSLGRLAAIGVRDGKSGVICAMRCLHKRPEEWIPMLTSLLPLLKLEERSGCKRVVIAKTLVDLRGPAFLQFAQIRASLAIDDQYQFPGPIQFFGNESSVDSGPLFLQIKF